MDEDKTFVAISSNRYSPEMKETLYEIGLLYEEFVVGYLGPRFTNYAEQTLHYRLQRGKNIVIFNWKQNYYYETSNYFTKDFLAKQFNSTEYISRFKEILEDIRNEKLKPVFASEPIPEINNTLQKIVGKTYKNFINDEEKDVIVLYTREGCEHCANFFPVFQNFASECSNEDFLKFGYIDITKNSCEGGFPFMEGVPHVRIFPMRNKRDDDSLREGFNRESLIRFVNICGSKKLSVKEPDFDRKAVSQELMKLVYRSQSFPLIEKEKLKKYLQKVLGTNETSSSNENNPQFDEL
ncbi:protein disulfide isomerase, putative [Trichomonas vaginalis G3]|uniref:protein disulfide-isomerase n=1 Tax=Trichomonas vaginalis (strain ATCC PRA-98 / G3) TaxID=412133 RepID=A2GJ24_TRIV3|nr:intramolecular oxidoreductase activity, transposing S-S bonds [Trichomonas vaginalis G3]EAX82844.1 protein disulfide isomerase, putative [Trichomonas vaginalis G3]KAI5538393.1 intramolecular oxidoreductase activity, transposing S-S bonds [Trichomonas vaginalis G3]|eukprot:XP_001295774.1 protein disulfide isomerase [Trichomonas vaginalis G3]